MKIVLGSELARQRAEAGVKQDDAAEILRCTQQKIAHIESGSGIRPKELDALLERYAAAETDQSYARDLQAEGNRRTKKGAFSTRFRQNMRLLVDMEPSCQRFFSYQAMVVPGLLQTEQYMRTLFRAWRPSPGQEQIDRDTADRLARQRVLDNIDQQFWFVFDEAALRRTVGCAEIVKEQVQWLIEVLDRPNVELQIVPFSTGFYMGQGHDYSIFGYDTRPPVSIVYLEQHDGGTYVDDSKRANRYLALWEQQKAAAPGPEQTRRLLLASPVPSDQSSSKTQGQQRRMPSNNTNAYRRDGLGGWFKSSRSNPNGNQCVEVFFDVDLVHIRDSKDGGAGPVLSLPAADWATFLDEVVGRAPVGSNAAVRITTNSGGGADLRDTRSSDTTLSYTAGEWSAFVAGVHAAEFDLTSAPERAES